MSAETKRTTDHDTIRDWAERAGVPARAPGAEDEDDADVLRIVFPEEGGQDGLEHISWEEWFQEFDETNLCFLYQEKRASGEGSTFFKLVRQS